MDDADDEKRTLIFNVLANLPEKVIQDIYMGLAHPDEAADTTYIIDVLVELLPEVKVRVEQERIFGGIFIPKLIHAYALLRGIPHNEEHHIEFNAVDNWWRNASTEQRREFLQMGPIVDDVGER